MGSKINNDESCLNENNFENPFKEIKILKELTNDSYVYLVQDNTFIIFKSINDILYLIYSTKNKSIISFDLINNKKINEIKNPHNNNYITNFRYYFDNINKRDLIISISAQNNNLKLWNINNFECLLNIQKIYNDGILSSSCILNDNNKNYIIVSNFNVWESEPIKIFDLKGIKIKEINDNTNDKTFLIDIYHDKKSFKNYIITGNWGYIKSYDYHKDKIYHKYSENDKRSHYNLVITTREKIIILIESDGGNIRIWNFHSGLLLNKINICDKGLRGVCLWNTNYLIVGNNEALILIDLRNNKIIQNNTCSDYMIGTIKKIKHPIYGECLISQGLKNEQIKLWITN